MDLAEVEVELLLELDLDDRDVLLGDALGEDGGPQQQDALELDLQQPVHLRLLLLSPAQPHRPQPLGQVYGL